MIGSNSPIDLTSAYFSQRLASPEVRAVAARSPFFRSAANVRLFVVGDLRAVADQFADSPVNTDDSPVFALRGPKAIPRRDYLQGFALLDWMGTKRGWLIKVQLAIAAVCGLLALLVGIGPNEKPPEAQRVSWESLAHTIDPHTGLSHQHILIGILILFVVLAILSATNDVAVDAFYIAGLPDKQDQAAYSGLR